MLSKLNINNFMCLSNIEVDFNHNFTSINGKPGLTKGLSSLIEAIRFVLECSELDFNEICSSTNYQEDNPSVYVEATISDPFGRSNIFRKSIFDHTIVYHIDGNVSNQLEFKRLLLSSQVVQPLMSTFIIDSQMVDMVTVLRDGKRTNLIETFCYDDKDEIISNYNRMFQFIDDAKHDMNLNLKKQRALNAEKRKIHKKNESNKRRSQLVKEFDGKSIQFNLFKIFHNAKFLESVENFNHDEQLLIEDFESSIVEQDDILIHSYHNKNIATEEIKQMNQQIEELNEDFIKSKELHNQNKIIDNVQSNLKRYLETIKEDIAKRIRSIRCDIEQLGSNSNDLKDEYSQLNSNFNQDLENVLWELELKTRKTVACEAEMEELQDDLKSSFHTLNNLENKFYPLNEKLNELKTVLMEKLQKKKQLESFLVPKLQSISPESSVNNIKARENILKDLKENFSSRIIGRLSQLWPTSGETDADHCNVFKRLGEFSETIIVDTKETALECISYLKLKQLSDINEAFLPLNELSDQKTSNDFLPAGELPPYCEIVEKLIKVSNEELMRSFIYFLKPSLICGSLNESETLITWDGSKKLNVVSRDTSTCFDKEGFLKYDGLDHEKIHEVTTVDDSESYRRKNSEILEKKTELWSLNDELQLIGKEIKIYEKMSASQKQLLEHEKKHYEYLKEVIKTLECSDKRIRQMESISSMQGKLDKKMEIHFNDFCKKFGFESIKMFLKNNKSWLLASEINLKLEEIAQWENEYLKLNSVFQNFPSEALNNLEQELITNKSRINQEMENFHQKNNVRSNSIKEMQEIESKSFELIENISKSYEKVYDNLHRIQVCLKENYEIIVKNFMDYNSISLVNGLMENVIVTPDDLPDNVSLIQEQLKRLEVNFESLHQNLKGNVNVVEKSREFLIALDTLSQQIEKERGKIGKDLSQTRIKRINSDLAAISQKVALQKKNVGSVKEKFEEVAVERKERFVKCLNALNNGIGECCQQMFDGNVIANLKVAKNNDEPYLGDTIFTWYTISNSPKILTELDKNYDAALAFIFAIVKMKGHKLIILNDISGKISKHAKKFIHLQNDYQIISISSRRSDMDTSNFLLHPDSKSNLFTIKRCR